MIPTKKIQGGGYYVRQTKVRDIEDQAVMFCKVKLNNISQNVSLKGGRGL